MFKCIRTVFWTQKPIHFLQHNTHSSNFESNSRSKHQLVTPNITASRPLHSCNQSNHEAPPSHSQHHPQRCPSHPAGKFQPNPPTAKPPPKLTPQRPHLNPPPPPTALASWTHPPPAAAWAPHAHRPPSISTAARHQPETFELSASSTPRRAGTC